MLFEDQKQVLQKMQSIFRSSWEDNAEEIRYRRLEVDQNSTGRADANASAAEIPGENAEKPQDKFLGFEQTEAAIDSLEDTLPAAVTTVNETPSTKQDAIIRARQATRDFSKLIEMPTNTVLLNINQISKMVQRASNATDAVRLR